MFTVLSICGKKAMHITKERHLLSVKFRCQIIAQILMSNMDQTRKRCRIIYPMPSSCRFSLDNQIYFIIKYFCRFGCPWRLREEWKIFCQAPEEHCLPMIPSVARVKAANSLYLLKQLKAVPYWRMMLPRRNTALNLETGIKKWRCAYQPGYCPLL